MDFHRTRNTLLPKLKLKETSIQLVETHKFLGLILDSKLNFLPHIKYIKTKCQKSLNLLRTLASTEWGSNKDQLLKIYRTTVRPILDYGSIIYGSAPKSYLKMLEPIQNQALRLCLGAFRTTNAHSLHVEANEPPLEIRRQTLSLNYLSKSMSTPRNSTTRTILKSQRLKSHYDNRKKSTPSLSEPYGLRNLDAANKLNINTSSVKEIINPPSIPPWERHQCKVILDLSKTPKSESNPISHKESFYNIKQNFVDHVEMYTDGSMNETGVAAGMVAYWKHKKITETSKRLPDKSSIFSAEARAIQMALSYIATYNQKNYIIYSDSLSCLQAIKSTEHRNPAISHIQAQIHNLIVNGKRITLCWIPGHVGIKGNEEADNIAKRGISKPIYTEPIPSQDYKPHIRNHTNKIWQSEWDKQTTNKLRKIKQNINCKQYKYPLKRREQVVLTRCRLGHTYITHNYLLKGSPPPECTDCQQTLTVEHILTNCRKLTPIRNKYFTHQNLPSLFEHTEPKTIINYLKEIEIYQSI